MLRKIKSPAVKANLPSSPIVHIDSFCVSREGLFVDKLGNTFDCDSSLSLWTDGISSGKIVIGQSFLNLMNFSISFSIKSNSNSVIRPVIFGDRSANGFWLEVHGEMFLWRDNSGIVCNAVFDPVNTIGITRNNKTISFYKDGSTLITTQIYEDTENSTVFDMPDGCKINHMIIYNRTLTDDEMMNLHNCNFQRSSGLDSFGYRNSSQSIG